MVIPDDIRKCVAFIGFQLADGSFRLAGSLFFLGSDKDGGASVTRMWAVTAKHVIDNIRSTGVENAFLRINLKDGQAQWFKTPLSSWFHHPSDSSIDVAIFEMGLPAIFDHLVLPYSLCATDQKMKESEVGLGDEVFVTGLFTHHHGSRKNIPIVRVGNLACMTEEKITTNLFGEIDAYLIEARSIGGLSGSPVFLNLGSSRMIGGNMVFGASGPRFLLLGLIHGHYDVNSSDVDQMGDSGSKPGQSDRINTGIAIVVPFSRIDSVITSYLVAH